MQFENQVSNYNMHPYWTEVLNIKCHIGYDVELYGTDTCR